MRSWPIRPVLLVAPVHRNRGLGHPEGEAAGLVPYLAVGRQDGVVAPQFDIK
jgi:hypothetical protein